MKYIHNITITAFVSEDEDLEAVQTALEQFLPEDYEREKIDLSVEHAHIDEGQDIDIASVKLLKDRHCRHVLEVLKEKLSEEQIARLYEEENRVDEQGQFFLRLDKQKFVEDGEAVLVDHGDCIHIKMTVACYPKNRANALSVVKEMLA